jgi:hypothetical protein
MECCGEAWSPQKPYKGNGQAIGDLIGGHVSMMVLSLSTISRQCQDRQAVRARGDDAGPLQAFA